MSKEKVGNAFETRYLLNHSKISRGWRSVFLLVALVYSVSVWQGFYGFGTDYYAAYKGSNFSWGGITDVLGWRISTLTVFGIHLGVFIVSFSIAVSLFLLLSQVRSWRFRWWSFPGLLVFVLFLHTWPIVMSNSNVMRQGLMMAAVWLGLVLFDRGANRMGLVVCVLLLFLHTAGWYFSLLLLVSWWLGRLGKGSTFFGQGLWFELSAAIFLFTLAFYLGGVAYLDGQSLRESRIIGLDLRWFFLFVNFLYLLSWVFLVETYRKFEATFLLLLLVSISAPILLLAGFNWEYERINMVISIPYCLAFCGIFFANSRLTALVGVSSIFAIATVAAGLFGKLQ